ncbi:myb/SANT-like DNA-binding domain-containing protein 1 [Brienomyrus brachyistius]|uniref:myb/SANT-like DNA-binding domain-containing protein 1 n=1 Tax=Brienomyrus brachyistius TaxID=42636 RepID=UPI0020B3E418|nr:myb/SANT-like DNA-binding domain-containing protein 1 [Brienomyrus brachyistius]
MAAEDNLGLMQSGQSEKHRRARNWTDAEMKGLVYVWEEFITELRKAKRNAKIYEKMAKRFFELTGEHRHREEIKMKITNMTFQYRKMKCVTNGSTPSPEWPYFRAIDRILSQTLDLNGLPSCDLQPTPPPSAPQPESKSVPTEPSPSGFIPEYTGSSEEQEPPEEGGHSESSASLQSPESRSPQAPIRRKKIQCLSLKRRKLRVLEAMLQEQRKAGRNLEEVCREVRRVMHQQNFLQVQSLQLQERMMNLLEKMISPPTQPPAWVSTGAREPGPSQA